MLPQWIESLRRALTSGHVLHMEVEIAQLRGQVAMLHLQLVEALKPTVPARAAVPKVPVFAKFTPQQTSWETYLAEQIRLQEIEEEPADGTHSGGRK